MTAGIILDVEKTYVCHQLPGTYFVGTVVGWTDDPLLGRTYQFADYAWVQEQGRMSAFAACVQTGRFGSDVRIEYDGVGSPPRLIPACFIANARALPHPVKQNVPE